MNPISFFNSQLRVDLPYPNKDISGQTVIVTGANTGIGLEAARHFTRLNAKKVILGVRSVEKGEAAREIIEQSTEKRNVIEGWPLDLSSYASVKTFGQRMQSLDRLDALVENAGLFTPDWAMAEEDETTITVNVVSTFLLAVLALPKLRETAVTFGITPRLSVTGSDLYGLAKFPEKKSQHIFQSLNDKSKSKMADRYATSKLLDLYAMRELAAQTTASEKTPVVINIINPGLCHSELVRHIKGPRAKLMKLVDVALARTAEQGSRMHFLSAQSGMESHGKWMSDGRVSE